MGFGRVDGVFSLRPKEKARGQQLAGALNQYAKNERPLKGLKKMTRQKTFVEQLVESERRVRIVPVMKQRLISPSRCDPSSHLYDPLKAAIHFQNQGDIDEAFWQVFLFVHFGRHKRAGWRYARRVYGRLGKGPHWDWKAVSADPTGFRDWLDKNQEQIKVGTPPGGFGPHRRYQSLSATSGSGTGAAVESYVNWVAPPRTHDQLFGGFVSAANNDPRAAFRSLYRSMKSIAGFGRLARFDYLAMVGKLSLAQIEPDSTYMSSATGPLHGARLLFKNDASANVSPTELDNWLIELDLYLGVGMQALEDALCNWQKSPSRFVAFRG